MKTFEFTVTVTQEDLDELNHVNNIRYIQWIQDIAKAHWQEIATEDIYKAYFWVVRRHLVDYKASAHLHDQVKITTKFINSYGAAAKSIIQMHNKSTQKLLLKAETTWCLMQTQTKRPTRVPKEIDEILK
ncbi:thioesterase family protein [Lacinutrix sp. C3R15]|uniref:acyl-CoA thioesterase n=1 Tax=Flavobacteriaceae TaxID=49546 RepID=UPI001C088E58|nr:MULTISPECIES: thioesterase family protein [Flavobacteriaceae]MBU2938796.1 thioesterase family protein [Lacinutrix sp. C3R15]MDO6622109.1 thioesterase [Oceanihabitans sp. 1_MG-2023]